MSNTPTLTYFDRNKEDDFDRVIEVNGPINDNGEIATVILYEGDNKHNRSVLVAVNKPVSSEETYNMLGFNTEMSVDIVAGELKYINNTIIIVNKVEGIDDIITDTFDELHILEAVTTSPEPYFEHMRKDIIHYQLQGNDRKVKYINPKIIKDAIMYTNRFIDDFGEERDVIIYKTADNSFNVVVSRMEDDIDAEGNRIVSDRKEYIVSANFENINGGWSITRYNVANQIIDTRYHKQNIVDMILHSNEWSEFRNKYKI